MLHQATSDFWTKVTIATISGKCSYMIGWSFEKQAKLCYHKLFPYKTILLYITIIYIPVKPVSQNLEEIRNCNNNEDSA